MLRKVSELIGYTIHATDGDVGSVSTIWFDDERWAVRYFVVDTGTWLPGRKVLISPISVRQASRSGRALDVPLTREQIKNSPDIDTHRPVSRQHEADYHAYYGYPYYWGGAGLWGAGAYPMYLARTEMVRGMEEARAAEEAINLRDSHLRDVHAVQGDHLRATDGEIGHVDDFLVDDRSWAIRYLVVDTSNWLGGRHVLVAPSWVSGISWERSLVDVKMTREAIKNSPEYVAAGEVDRAYEQDLHAHYGETGYWTDRDSDTDLARLEDCDDLEVADGEPDVRGWRVIASDGVEIGKVEHLIVDPPSMRVNYLEVGVEKPAAATGHRDVLIPLEHTDLDEGTHDVRLRTLSSAGASGLPAFKGFPIDAAYADRLRASFGARASAGPPQREVRLGRPGTAAAPKPGFHPPPPAAASGLRQEQIVNRSSDQRYDANRDRDRERDPRIENEDPSAKK